MKTLPELTFPLGSHPKATGWHSGVFSILPKPVFLGPFLPFLTKSLVPKSQDGKDFHASLLSAWEQLFPRSVTAHYSSFNSNVTLDSKSPRGQALRGLSSGTSQRENYLAVQILLN